jgi:hypothetical protein
MLGVSGELFVTVIAITIASYAEMVSLAFEILVRGDGSKGKLEWIR